jgi:hypothetical protein
MEVDVAVTTIAVEIVNPSSVQCRSEGEMVARSTPTLPGMSQGCTRHLDRP